MLVVNIGDFAVDFYPECTLVDARKLPYIKSQQRQQIELINT